MIFFCEDLVSESMSSVAFASEKFEVHQGWPVVSRIFDILSNFSKFSKMFGCCPRALDELSEFQGACFKQCYASVPSLQAVRAVNHG